MLVQKSVTGEVPAPMTNVLHNALAQVYGVLRDVRICENFWNEGLERVNEERAHSLEEVNSYDVKKEKLENTLAKKEVAMKAIKHSQLELERKVNRLQME